MGGRRAVALAAMLAAVALATIVALLPAGRAQAHAALIDSSPAANETLRRPPTRVILHFSEGIERKLTEIEVSNRNGDRVDQNDIAFDDKDPTFASIGVKDLKPDLYYVKWSNVSAVDGHNYSGTFPFIVLNSDGSLPQGVSLDRTGGVTTSGGQLLPSNVDSALKWIALVALATVAGAAFMLVAGIRPGASFLEEDDYRLVTETAERWVGYVAHALLPLSFIAAAFLVLRTVDRFGTSTGVFQYLTEVRVGQYRLAGLVLVLVALAGAGALLLSANRRVRDAGLTVLLLGSAGALFTYSISSHGATNPGKLWSVTSDYLHLLASSTWLGSLAMIFVFLRWRRVGLHETPRLLLLANVLDRFSIIAGLSVMTILATGVYNGLAAIPTAGALIHTTYGRVLLAKIALLLPLLAIAGVNAYVLKPRLVSTIDQLYGEASRGVEPQAVGWQDRLRWLQRVMVPTVAAEIVLVIAVFAAVGVLTQTSTAKGEVAQQQAAKAASTKFHQQGTAGNLNLTLDVTPNQVGINDFSVTVQNADGSPSTTVTQVRLRFNYEQVANLVPQSASILGKRADGAYRGEVSDLSQSGNWRVEVDVRRSDADDVSRQFIVAVAVPPGTIGATGGALSLPFTVFNWNEVAGAFLALGGAAIIIYRKQLRWLRQPRYRLGMAAATLLLLGGAVLAFGVHSHTQASNPTAGNPVKPTQASVERGRLLFQQNCAQCHGVNGAGDGPAAAQLNPAPSDFRQHIPYHTDPQFYNFIANGYPQSAMPKFKDAFSAQDIWNLVNFLRATFSTGATQ